MRLGRGRLPGAARAALDAEGMVVLRERVGGSVTFRRFHAPGKRYSLLRRKWLNAALVVTQRGLVAYAFAGASSTSPATTLGCRALR